jgi:hypothetical protein
MAEELVEPWVVIETATVMSGSVLRWYRNETAAKWGRTFVSASREGVLVADGVYLDTIPTDVLDEAKAAYRDLAAGRRERASRFVTHRQRFGSDELIPVEPTAATSP